MTISESIEKKYEEIRKLARTFDDCLKAESGGWGAEVQPDKIDEYWKTRECLESEVSEWMANIRKAMNALPASIKKSVREERTDYGTGETYSVVKYDNKDYEAISGFLGDIANAVEGVRGILTLIVRPNRISETLRGIRGSVLSLCRSLEIFVPEIMVSIDQQVDLVFKLREKGMEETALLIEELDQIDDNAKKCLNSRTALEKVIEASCKEKGIEVKKGFYTNLDNAINAGLTEKSKRNAIAGHYTYVSKLIHGELETNARNTQFAVNGVINILQSFFQ